MVLAGAGLAGGERTEIRFAACSTLDDESQQADEVPLIWSNIGRGLFEWPHAESARLPFGTERDDPPRLDRRDACPDRSLGTGKVEQFDLR